MSQQLLIFFSMFSAYMGFSLIDPVFPQLARQLGMNETQTGLVITGAALMFASTSPFWSKRSEQVGRKNTIMVGLTGMSAGFLLFATVLRLGLAGVIEQPWIFPALVLSRVFVGGTFSAVAVSSQAYIADTTSGQNRTSGLALIGAANGTGLIIGPGISGLLARFGLLVPIYFGGIFPLIILLCVYLFLNKVDNIHSRTIRERLSVWDARLWPFLIVGFAQVIMITGLRVSSAFYFQDRLLLDDVQTASWVGGALMCAGLATLTMQLGVIRRLRLPPLRLLRIGLPLSCSGLFLLLFVTNFWTIGLAFLLVGAGFGLATPGFVAAVTLSVKPAEQDAVAGLTTLSQGSGGIVGPVI
ncbi:MAG: MFS transporter, partial [Deinococcota bacterium]